MVPRMSRLVLGMALLWGLGAGAETDRERQAREELERQLKTMVNTPPPRIKVQFDALFEGNFKLQDASFELDGRTLPVLNQNSLEQDGTHLIFEGQVTPGPHKLESHVAYRDASSVLVSAEAGYTWKIGSSISFATQPGIEVDVTVTPVYDRHATDRKQMLKLSSPAKVVMLAPLEDGRIPEEGRPKLAVVVLDAGEPDAGVKKTKAELAAEAAEAKRKAKEDALAAKKAAEDERKAKLEAARAEREAAAEEKRRLAEEARQARLANKGTGTGTQPVEVAAAEPVDAGPPPEPEDAGMVAEVDAGPPPPVAVVQPPPPPAPPPAEEGGIPLPVIIGIGVAVLGIIVFVVSRRRSQ